MQFLTDLWLPILLSSVFVFIASSLIHMVVKWHNSDYGRIPNEEAVRAALRGASVPPGQYVLPHCVSMSEMASPEMAQKYEEGPVGFVTMYPNGPPAIGKSLLHWFLYSVVISFFCAYIASITLAPGDHYLEVFQVTGAVAVVAYALSAVPDSIWKGTPWGVTLKFLVDGTIYGLVTAGTFGWLWPGA